MTTIKKEPTLIHKNYYPFGLNMQGHWDFDFPQIGTTNDYQFNGKELNEDYELNWIDYGARFYDPALARWGQVDPLASKYQSFSTYNYVLNNPINFIDPDGRHVETEIYNLQGKKVGEDDKGSDGNVAIVDSKVASKLKKGKINANEAIQSSKIQTTKVVIGEAVHVLGRTTGKDNNGHFEEVSVVSPDGEITKGKRGEAVDEEGIARVELPDVEGDDNVSIHSHLTHTELDVNEDVDYQSALEPGPDDPAGFENFPLNIIVGRLGPPTKEKQLDGTIKIIDAPLGAAFYYRNSNRLGKVSERALKKIIKK